MGGGGSLVWMVRCPWRPRCERHFKLFWSFVSAVSDDRTAGCVLRLASCLASTCRQRGLGRWKRRSQLINRGSSQPALPFRDKWPVSAASNCCLEGWRHMRQTGRAYMYEKKVEKQKVESEKVKIGKKAGWGRVILPRQRMTPSQGLALFLLALHCRVASGPSGP